jgi:hypothetical protein
MHLAWAHGVDRIWIVNVGDIKPMELPVSFFLDYAWDPGDWNEKNLQNYFTLWAQQQFGKTHAKGIASILESYSQLSARIKPELLSQHTYSRNYSEWKGVVKEWKNLEARAGKISTLLPSSFRDAYFQLVWHPVKAFGNLHELYYAVAQNHFLAEQNDAGANDWADSARARYAEDSLLSLQYNRDLSGGKWNHMMDQTHIGYTYWQQPPVNKMPELKYSGNDSITVFWDSGFPRSHAVTPSNGKDYPKMHAADETKGYISMESKDWSRAVNTNEIRWTLIPGIGKTGAGVTPFPVTSPPQTPGGSGPHLEYEIFLTDTGKAIIHTYFSPTLNYHDLPEGMRYAVSINEEQPQVISVNHEDRNTRIWEGWVANNINVRSSTHHFKNEGRNIIKIWMVDAGLVLQKIVIDLGGLRPSYLGPPSTLIKK